MTRRFAHWFVALSLCLARVPPLGAQDVAQPRPDSMGPPPALSGPMLTPLRFIEQSLSFGAFLRSVERGGQPLVSVHLFLRAGEVDDPPGEEGTARLAARLVVEGGVSRLPVLERLQELGAHPTVRVSPEWTEFAVDLMADDLERGLALFAELVTRPRVDGAALGRTRDRLSQELALLENDPSFAAAGTLAALIDPAWVGRALASAATVGGLTPDGVERFRRKHYVPGAARFVVTGAVPALRAREALERTFSGWVGAAPPAREALPSPAPTTGGQGALRVWLVDYPDAERASLAMGHAVASGDDGEWALLGVASKMFGRGLGIEAEVLRRSLGGVLRIAATLPPELAAPAAQEVIREIERVRTAIAGPPEVQRARAALLGRQAREEAAPSALARALGSAWMLGSTAPDVAATSRLLEGIDGQDPRDAAARRLDSGALVVVVAGDARRLRSPLSRIGAVTIVERGAAAAPRQAEGAQPRAPAAVHELTPGSWTYAVRVQGVTAGTVERVLEPDVSEGRALWRFRTTARFGPVTSEDWVEFTQGPFLALAGMGRRTVGDQRIEGQVALAQGRMVGRVEDAAGVRILDEAVGPEVMVGDMRELILWVGALKAGDEYAFEALSPRTGRVRRTTASVGAVETVTVPAGRFEVVPVDLASGGRVERLYLRAAAPHVLVKLESRDPAMTLELMQSP